MAYSADTFALGGRQPVAAAANPFGLGGASGPSPNPTPMAAAALNGGGGNGGGSVTPPPPTGGSDGSGGGSGGSSGGGSTTTPPPGDITVGGYDLSTDPVLQMVQAAMTRNDSMAQASALTAREQALLNYGDPTLAAAVLGSSDPFVAASGQNQESVLSQLARQQGLNERNYTNSLDPSLAFSGARISGEQQLGDAYQTALYNAAQALQAQLTGITGSLNSTLSGDAGTLEQAIADAYNRAVLNALTNPPASDSTTAPTTDPTTVPGLVTAAATNPTIDGYIRSRGGRLVY